MEPVTSQRGRKRAENEKAVLLKQLADIDAKRKASNLTFDGMAAMIEGHLREVNLAIDDYDAGGNVQESFHAPQQKGGGE